VSAQRQGQLTQPVTGEDHILGPETAPVTLVEYGDFECSNCRKAAGIVEQLLEHSGDNVRFVFRPFPLTSGHPHAQQAAEAAEAAAAQGKFWEMHARLFRHQDSLDDAALARYAAELDLDVERFKAELAEGKWYDRVHDAFLGGVRSGVNGTPTFFINGRRHDGPWELPELKDAVQRAGETEE
jgi:protein-disulfide isomerase